MKKIFLNYDDDNQNEIVYPVINIYEVLYEKGNVINIIEILLKRKKIK